MDLSPRPALPLPGSAPGSVPSSTPGSPPAAHTPPPPLCMQRPPPLDSPSLPRADSEDIVTYISEGMTVTSADEEKLQLLNKNTELRRINKELMKLNQEWDQIYRSTALGLQQRVRALQHETLALRRQAEGLAARLEHEQSKREYYEQTLIQELRKNQRLQEHLRQLQSSQQHGQPGQPAATTQPWDARALRTGSQPVSPVSPAQSLEACGEAPDCAEPMPRALGSERCRARAAGCSDWEVTDLKEQLEALKCQTEIYEADYRTELRDRERVEAENEQLRKKEQEMRQQMLLLQEQLKIFEADFRKERSDKQLLQRLLKSKSAPREPVLVHRCNSHEQPGAAARRMERPGRKAGACGGCADTRLQAFGGDC